MKSMRLAAVTLGWSKVYLIPSWKLCMKEKKKRAEFKTFTLLHYSEATVEVVDITSLNFSMLPPPKKTTKNNNNSAIMLEDPKPR